MEKRARRESKLGEYAHGRKICLNFRNAFHHSEFHLHFTYVAIHILNTDQKAMEAGSYSSHIQYNDTIVKFKIFKNGIGQMSIGADMFGLHFFTRQILNVNFHMYT